MVVDMWVTEYPAFVASGCSLKDEASSVQRANATPPPPGSQSQGRRTGKGTGVEICPGTALSTEKGPGRVPARPPGCHSRSPVLPRPARGGVGEGARPTAGLTGPSGRAPPERRQRPGGGDGQAVSGARAEAGGGLSLRRRVRPRGRGARPPPGCRASRCR